MPNWFDSRTYWKIRAGRSRLFRTKGRTDDRLGIADIDIFPTNLSLGNHRKNVCVPLLKGKVQGNNTYLDSTWSGSRTDRVAGARKPGVDDAVRWMWIAEIKTAGNFLDDKELVDKYQLLINSKSLTRGGQDADREARVSLARVCGMVDVNFDGVPDCVGSDSLLYSHGNEYFEMEFLDGNERVTEGHGDGTLRFPPSGKTCVVLDTVHLAFTTGGKRIFLNNVCNLTELTK